MSDRNSHFSKQVIGRDKVCQECGTADDLQAHHMEWEIRRREAEGKGEATKFYSTKEATKYLGLSVSAVKYHVHTAANLQPTLVGHALVFTQAQLDKFNIMKRDPGRPRKKNSA